MRSFIARRLEGQPLGLILATYLVDSLNVAGALHPVILKDGRLLFSSLESQGLHGSIAWGIWSIHPDGTNWGRPTGVEATSTAANAAATALRAGVAEGYDLC